jgi:hypothetical protein
MPCSPSFDEQAAKVGALEALDEALREEHL